MRGGGSLSPERSSDPEQWALHLSSSTPQTQLHLPGLDSSNVSSPNCNVSLFRSCSRLRGCLPLAIKKG